MAVKERHIPVLQFLISVESEEDIRGGLSIMERTPVQIVYMALRFGLENIHQACPQLLEYARARGDRQLADLLSGIIKGPKATSDREFSRASAHQVVVATKTDA